jgi:hypothetical protein
MTEIPGPASVWMPPSAFTNNVGAPEGCGNVDATGDGQVVEVRCGQPIDEPFKLFIAETLHLPVQQSGRPP